MTTPRRRRQIWSLIAIPLVVAILAGSVAWTQNAASPSTTTPADTHAPLAAAKTEPTLLSVADEYVKVVGGVLTGLGTVFGLPLVYQTFRKTRAEIAKINLEAAKLRRDLSEAAPGAIQATQDAYRINIEGTGNYVSILTDPRWATPLLVLVDALIASIFSTIASYAIGFLSLPSFVIGPIRLIVYLAIFYPVFQAARQVKKNLGADLRPKYEGQVAPADPAS